MSCLINNVQRVKYNPNVLLKYIFDDDDYDDKHNVPNVIHICRVQVKRTGGAVLAHYFAQIYLSNEFSFEFHPGSQPKTFQNINTNKNHAIIKTLLLCKECCKKELKYMINGENGFNIAFRNCEAILCKKQSVQTIIGAVLLIILLINIINFRVTNIVIVIFLLVLLCIVNNYLLMNPFVEYCKHYGGNNFKLEYSGQHDKHVQNE